MRKIMNKCDIYKYCFSKRVTVVRGAHSTSGYCTLNAPSNQKHLIWCVCFDGEIRTECEWQNVYIEEKNEILEIYNASKEPKAINYEEFKSYRLIIDRSQSINKPKVLGIFQGDNEERKNGKIIRRFKKINIKPPYYK
jgi:hypothetical protein